MYVSVCLNVSVYSTAFSVMMSNLFCPLSSYRCILKHHFKCLYVVPCHLLYMSSLFLGVCCSECFSFRGVPYWAVWVKLVCVEKWGLNIESPCNHIRFKQWVVYLGFELVVPCYSDKREYILTKLLFCVLFIAFGYSFNAHNVYVSDVLTVGILINCCDCNLCHIIQNGSTCSHT